MSAEFTTLPIVPVEVSASTRELDSGQPIRVCFLIDRLARAGTETQLVALIDRLDRRRVQPYLCLLDGNDPESRTLEPTNCPVLRLGVHRLLCPRGLAGALTLSRFLKRERIDILQLYFPDSTYLGVLAARLAGVPRVVRIRNNANHWMTHVHRTLGRVLNPHFVATVCNSEAGRRAVLADERPDPASVIVIGNGVDVDRFTWIAPPDAIDDPTKPRRVGLVANLRAVKGIDLLVRAATRVVRECPAVTFHVAGEGPHRADLERLVSVLGLAGRFELIGRCSDIPGLLARLDIAVLCSHSEGMPNSVLEYMAAGRPIVATAVGAVPDLIEDGVHGLLVPPGEPDRLAKAIARLLEDRGLAARLGAAAQARVRTCYCREVMVRKFESFWHDLIVGGSIVRP